MFVWQITSSYLRGQLFLKKSSSLIFLWLTNPVYWAMLLTLHARTFFDVFQNPQHKRFCLADNTTLLPCQRPMTLSMQLEVGPLRLRWLKINFPAKTKLLSQSRAWHYWVSVVSCKSWYLFKSFVKIASSLKMPQHISNIMGVARP